MNDQCQWKAQHIGHNVFLATLYLLVSLNAAVAVNVMGGFDTSGVYDSQTGAVVTARGNSNFFDKNGQYFFKSAVILPLPEIIVDKIPRSEIAWEHSPLANI